MIYQKQVAHKDGNCKLYNKPKCDITRFITNNKLKYSKKIQLQLVNQPAKAWIDIKKISGLPQSKTTTAKANPFTPDDLNTFFT